MQDMHGCKIQKKKPKLQQACRYRSLGFIFTQISSRASESEKAYILVNEHACNLTKFIEDTLYLEMVGNSHEKGHDSKDVGKMDCTQDSDLMKTKELKKKETS